MVREGSQWCDRRTEPPNGNPPVRQRHARRTICDAPDRAPPRVLCLVQRRRAAATARPAGWARHHRRSHRIVQCRARWLPRVAADKVLA
eukprot:6919102-Prymnesium_polylepis.1